MATKTTFDIRAAICFVAVAEEASFTRGAERLGLSQPSASEMIRNLEDRLGFALFVRPSRRAQLTDKGKVFFEAAQKIARANEEAQGLAASLKLSILNRLRVGTTYTSAIIPERIALMQGYIASEPRVDLEVVHGIKSDLLRQLRTGEVDVAIVVRPFDDHGLQCLPLHHGIGHFLVPIEDPLALQDGIRIADLKGRTVATPPRDRDPEYVSSHFDPLAECGATLVQAPEDVDQAIESFARLRRMIHLRFGLGHGQRREFGDMVRLPILDHPIDLEFVLARRDETPSAPVAAFWALATAQLAHRKAAT